MRTEVIMTLDEFNQLKDVRETPNRILEKTINNLGAKLSEAEKTIKQLEKELSMYIIGGVKPRNEPEAVGNTSWKGNDEQRLKTYYQFTMKGKRDGTPYHEWHIDNLVAELGRTKSAVKSKASAMGYKLSKGFLSKK